MCAPSATKILGKVIGGWTTILRTSFKVICQRTTENGVEECSADLPPNHVQIGHPRTWYCPPKTDSPAWRRGIKGTPNSEQVTFGLGDRATHFTFNRTLWKRSTLVNRTRSDASQPSSELTQWPSDVEKSNRTRCLVRTRIEKSPDPSTEPIDSSMWFGNPICRY